MGSSLRKHIRPVEILWQFPFYIVLFNLKKHVNLIILCISHLEKFSAIPSVLCKLWEVWRGATLPVVLPGILSIPCLIKSMINILTLLERETLHLTYQLPRFPWLWKVRKC